jgi:hypothetical protein
MIRFLVTAALLGGLLQHVFGEEAPRRKARPAARGRARKPARRTSRRARQATA